jgi:hypothetical protein
MASDEVTLFLTACNRPRLLKQTLESFVKFNTYPIKEAIIMEDSGLQGINDFAKEILPCPVTILYNERRMGQMKSIENGLKYLKTSYVFHCEEDWEFYDTGFIEKSFEILKANKYITTVWLRSFHELTTMYKFPILHVNEWISQKNITDVSSDQDYYIVGPNTGNFSWNPGLKTYDVAMKFSPYSSETLPTSVCEGGMRDAFRDLGMVSALTNNKAGYVRHIGWNHHVY